MHDVAETVDALTVVRALESACVTELQIEVLGLAVHAHHGVREHEKARGQRFVLDLVLVPGSSDGLRERPARGHRQLLATPPTSRSRSRPSSAST